MPTKPARANRNTRATTTRGKRQPKASSAAPKRRASTTAAGSGARAPAGAAKKRSTTAKTRPTAATATTYLATLAPAVRDDAAAIDRIMRDATGEAPVLWGSSIVGYGSLHYRYDSGREGDWPIVAFAARATGITLYLMDGFADRAPLLARLGRHKIAKSCLYLKRVSDIDTGVLAELVRASVRVMRGRYPAST
jgi:hypothetical protein